MTPVHLYYEPLQIMNKLSALDLDTGKTGRAGGEVDAALSGKNYLSLEEYKAAAASGINTDPINVMRGVCSSHHCCFHRSKPSKRTQCPSSLVTLFLFGITNPLRSYSAVKSKISSKLVVCKLVVVHAPIARVTGCACHQEGYRPATPLSATVAIWSFLLYQGPRGDLYRYQCKLCGHNCNNGNLRERQSESPLPQERTSRLTCQEIAHEPLDRRKFLNILPYLTPNY